LPNQFSIAVEIIAAMVKHKTKSMIHFQEIKSDLLEIGDARVGIGHVAEAIGVREPENLREAEEEADAARDAESGIDGAVQFLQTGRALAAVALRTFGMVGRIRVESAALEGVLHVRQRFVRRQIPSGLGDLELCFVIDSQTSAGHAELDDEQDEQHDHVKEE